MDELAKRFADLAEKYGPTVADAAMNAVRIEVFSSLMASFIALGFACTMYWGGRCLMRMEVKDKFADGMPYFFGCVAVALATIPFAIFVWQWIDPWTWTALSHPDLWLAKKAFKI